MKKDKAKEVTEPRVIRVFVSSTFRDMQAERDELAKFIFPQLREWCEGRKLRPLVLPVSPEQEFVDRTVEVLVESNVMAYELTHRGRYVHHPAHYEHASKENLFFHWFACTI
jgi:hypothetical protein